MNAKNIRLSPGQAAWLGLALALCAVLLFIGGSANSAQAAAAPRTVASVASSPDVTCPAGQCFTDVPPANGFYTNVNNLYMDGIIGGYPCGGAGEPCDPDNRPYYRPGNTVTRQQMSKFVDLGRRNIADAIGTRLRMTNPTQIALVISSTTTDSIDASNASGAEAIQALCTRAGQNCWAMYSSAVTGDYAAVLSGGRGVSVYSNDDTYAALDANTAAATSYSVNGHSDNYRSVLAQNASTSWYALYVDAPVASTVGAHINGDLSVTGNLVVSGSKTGYVVDIMQNADASGLEAGDVVTIVGNSSAVIGSIPVVMVKKASTAYDTGVVGIVDEAVYVPDSKTQATYEAEQQAQRSALAQRQQGLAQAVATGTKFDPGTVSMPASTITDAEGTVHAVSNATTIATSGYANVVTLGSYKAVKVDASFGAIQPGDLLVASTHAGYAMKATDKTQTSGAVIGKALGGLETGTGVVPVMVTLK
ncbi:MAG TPA: S-layer homology domain-containing protein [Chloroflexia bacterium]|nr:S-layer homology domain-containing protein [Chloroflexia bacterium]